MYDKRTEILQYLKESAFADIYNQEYNSSEYNNKERLFGDVGLGRINDFLATGTMVAGALGAHVYSRKLNKLRSQLSIDKTNLGPKPTFKVEKAPTDLEKSNLDAYQNKYNLIDANYNTASLKAKKYLKWASNVETGGLIANAAMLAYRDHMDKKGIIPSKSSNLGDRSQSAMQLAIGNFVSGKRTGERSGLMGTGKGIGGHSISSVERAFLPGGNTPLGYLTLMGGSRPWIKQLGSLATTQWAGNAADAAAWGIGMPGIPFISQHMNTKDPYGTYSRFDIERGVGGEGYPSALELMAASHARRN